MRFRIYILMAAAFLWFVFASVFMYRSTWTLKDAKFHKDVVVEMGIHHNSNNVPANVYKFKMHGLDHGFVITRRKYTAYDTFVNNIKIGDTLSVYFEDWKHVEGKENNQVVQLEKDKLLLELLTYVIEKGHYNPAAIDDNFSKGVYKDYFEAIDPSKRFFLQSDIDEFSKFETQLDDQIKNKDLSGKLTAIRIGGALCHPDEGGIS